MFVENILFRIFISLIGLMLRNETKFKLFFNSAIPNKFEIIEMLKFKNIIAIATLSISVIGDVNPEGR